VVELLLGDDGVADARDGVGRNVGAATAGGGDGAETGERHAREKTKKVHGG
jgi:hypothetical protein